MVSMKRQQGFSLMEVAIAITIGIIVVAITAVMGQQLLARAKAENTVSDAKRVISEVRRVYGDAPTGYVALTNNDLKASTSGLDDLWITDDGGRFRVADSVLDVSSSNCIPGGTGANGDGFMTTLTIEPRICKDVLRAFRTEATALSTTIAGTTTTLTPTPQTATNALIDTACTGSVTSLTVSVCNN